MNCPCFKEEYVGICTASACPHVPSIAELERYCFNQDFRTCPFLDNTKSLSEGRRWQHTIADVKDLDHPEKHNALRETVARG